MTKKPAIVCLLLAALFGLFTALPTKAASLELVPEWGSSGVPTNVSMYVYVPDTVVENPPILLLLHYWGGTAASVFAQAEWGGIVDAADQYGFIMVVPERSADCWDSGSPQTLTHDGGGETHAIAQMVQYAIGAYDANADRVYVTGDSCGGMMTQAMLGVYPDLFKAGVAYAGVPIGGQWTPVTHTAQEWGDLARACYPGYSGPRPRVQLWHGTADDLINYANHTEAIMQWSNVLGLNTTPTSTDTVFIPGIANQWTRQVWKDANGETLIDAWTDIGGDHGPSDALFLARYVIPFLGLDKVGPVDPGAGGQRGRPRLNAERTTFVADNGQPLRGPYTSTEWTAATSYEEIAQMKSMGFNAVHLYGESFDINYPAPGSTAPGYATSHIDSIVASTRDLGLYLVITIGNGANNGNYNAAYVTNFWNHYSARYADETHVMFEIQNEPVAWGPPYSAANATPPGAVDMEIAAYNAIRANAPDTPVLLFSYAVLGDTGGAAAALTDIRAFNQSVFGTPDAVWTNVAVGFHGYAGAGSAVTAVESLINAGYPCFMTEFGDGTWGGGHGGLDVEGVANWERLGVSWLAFSYIPPWGVSDDVTRPDAYINRVVNSGLSWTPDYGSFPVARSVFGNGGYPWTTSGYINNALGGTLRIQAENFDNGGKNVAYHNANETNPGGQYRTGETVGIETTSDTGGGYNVGWIAAGDWLEYTMKISVAGTYNLRLRVAGAGAGSVQVLAYNNNRNQTTNGVDLAGEWMLPNTGGNQTWQTVTKSVFLAPGQQRLRVHALSAGFKLNWIELSPATTGPIANGTYKFLNAATALALDLDADNTVVTATPSSSNTQQWNLQHIGGGNYRVSSVPRGSGWDTWMSPLHLSPWGWGAGGGSCYLFEPTGGGYYRFFNAGGGSSFSPSSDGPASTLKESAYSGAVAQQWAIVAPSTPVFPSGLSATAISASQVGLAWNAVTGATSYNVKRSTTSGGPYATIASGVVDAHYTDSASPNTKYYYVVSAVTGAAESLDSVEATVDLPYPWTALDIGATGLQGSSVYGNGVFSVAGSGADIWGSSDAFRFVYMPVTGNCTIVARVASVQNSDGWAKAGVMIRGSLAANAANAFIAVTPGNGVTWQTRTTTGGNSGNAATGSLAAPYWVKLVRSGNTFTGYRSVDGVTWTQQGSASFTMASTAYVGLAVTSHNNSSLCMAVFDNVTAPDWPPPDTPSGLSALAASSTQVDLAWNNMDGAASYNVKRSATSGGPYTTIATGIAGTSYTDTGAPVADGCYYVVSAMVGGSETPDSGEAALNFPKLAGAIIGTPGSWNNLGDTIAKVFDTDLNTFFDAPIGNGAWAGLDLGEGNTIVQIKYCPRATFESRMVGGLFQGANLPDFSDAVTLGSVTVQPATGMFTSVNVANATTFRYVRYLSPDNGFGNVAELEFYGYAFVLQVPGGLSAAAVSSSQIDLNWNASDGATGYNVKRSLSNGGPYATIAANVAATSYSDSGISGDTTYYYVVSAVDESDESADSDAVSVLPYPWLTQDVGLVGLTGSASASGGAFSVTGSGSDIWGTADAFRYVYTAINGDCTLVARVVDVQNTDPGAKGGIMIRKSLDAGSASALVCATPSNGVSFQWRSSDGGTHASYAFAGLAAPHWIKLVRSGDTVSAYQSADGTTWTTHALWTRTVGLGGGTVYVGLAVSAHDNTQLCTATFDHVSGFILQPAAPVGLGATAVSDSRIDLSWTASAGASSYNVKRSTVQGGPYGIVVSNVVAEIYSDTVGLIAGTRYYYVVSAANAGAESADSDEASAVPSAVVGDGEYFIADCTIVGGTNFSLTVSNSVPGHLYQLLGTDNLLEPDWQPAGEAEAGTGTDLLFAIPVGEDLTNRYFKLDVQRQ